MIEWKDIPGYEGYYKISNSGDILSLKRKARKNEFIMNLRKTKDGHYQASLSKDGKTVKIQAHILVWRAFNGDIPKGYCIHHIDKNGLNNDINNLQMMTIKEHLSLHKKEYNPGQKKATLASAEKNKNNPVFRERMKVMAKIIAKNRIKPKYICTETAEIGTSEYFSNKLGCSKCAIVHVANHCKRCKSIKGYHFEKFKTNE